MRYREIQPAAEAREWIDTYWVMEIDAGEPTDVQRVVPDGRPELILNLDQPFESLQDGRWREQPRSFLAGQLTGPLLLRAAGAARILGVRFRPDGAGAVFSTPMNETADRAVPLADLSPALARSLDDAEGSVASVEAALLAAAPKSDALAAAAVSLITRARGACDLAHLAAELGVSLRQFERRFLRAVGMPPKLFCRIQRFQAVFQHIEAKRPDWVDVAAACGYYDQAHLIRDFREFAGSTPPVLMADCALARHFLSHFSKTGVGTSA